MKDYIDGKPYYGIGEMASIEKRVEFLEELKTKSKEQNVKKKCDDLLKEWANSALMFP
ncbi:hypothetical protein GWN49_01145 [Candidatus Bathyarchaeota archaeon]|nr:hypothetical protein [Candidatus Bathyarchaeota archaeon]